MNNKYIYCVLITLILIYILLNKIHLLFIDCVNSIKYILTYANTFYKQYKIKCKNYHIPKLPLNIIKFLSFIKNTFKITINDKIICHNNNNVSFNKNFIIITNHKYRFKDILIIKNIFNNSKTLTSIANEITFLNNEMLNLVNMIDVSNKSKNKKNYDIEKIILDTLENHNLIIHMGQINYIGDKDKIRYSSFKIAAKYNIPILPICILKRKQQNIYDVYIEKYIISNDWNYLLDKTYNSITKYY